MTVEVKDAALKWWRMSFEESPGISQTQRLVVNSHFRLRKEHVTPRILTTSGLGEKTVFAENTLKGYSIKGRLSHKARRPQNKTEARLFSMTYETNKQKKRGEKREDRSVRKEKTW